MFIQSYKKKKDWLLNKNLKKYYVTDELVSIKKLK